MFLILIAIQACLIIYTNQTEQSTVIWTFINGLDGWGTSAFTLTLIGIAAGIGLIGIAAASTFGIKTDFLIFAPAIAGFITVGVVLSNLANFMRSELTSRIFYCDPAALALAILEDCEASATSTSTFIVAIIIGPIALYYVWTIIEWWRGKDF